MKYKNEFINKKEQKITTLKTANKSKIKTFEIEVANRKLILTIIKLIYFMFIKKIKIVYFKHEKNLILEICQNHNGSRAYLKDDHAASETGAKFVKIQDIHSRELTNRSKFDKGFQKMGKFIL